jgi:hypothetical protein
MRKTDNKLPEGGKRRSAIEKTLLDPPPLSRERTPPPSLVGTAIP